jgi:uncharacterized protein
MKFTRDTVAGDVRMVRRCETGCIVTTHETLTASAILMGATVLTDWPPQRIEALSAADLDAVLALDPELVLLGTGARLRFPAPDLLARCTARQVGIEVMDTQAACRTYNVLVAEGRRVAAGLILP